MKANNVKQNITTALLALLAEKAWAEISVSEICQRAQVSRMGFYRHFATPEAVLEDYIWECFCATVTQIKSERALNLQTKNVLVTTLTAFQQHRATLQLLIDQKLDSLLMKCYGRAFFSLYPDQRPTVAREYWGQMLVGELFAFELEWLRRGMKETPPQMAELFCRLHKIRLE